MDFPPTIVKSWKRRLRVGDYTMEQQIWVKFVLPVSDPQLYHFCLQHEPNCNSPGHFYSTSTFAGSFMFLFLQREQCILLLTTSSLGQQSSVLPALAKSCELALAKSPVCSYTAALLRLLGFHTRMTCNSRAVPMSILVSKNHLLELYPYFSRFSHLQNSSKEI